MCRWMIAQKFFQILWNDSRIEIYALRPTPLRWQRYLWFSYIIAGLSQSFIVRLMCQNLQSLTLISFHSASAAAASGKEMAYSYILPRCSGFSLWNKSEQRLSWKKWWKGLWNYMAHLSEFRLIVSAVECLLICEPEKNGKSFSADWSCNVLILLWKRRLTAKAWQAKLKTT